VRLPSCKDGQPTASCGGRATALPPPDLPGGGASELARRSGGAWACEVGGWVRALAERGQGGGGGWRDGANFPYILQKVSLDITELSLDITDYIHVMDYKRHIIRHVT
jgi:hypothetical protein